MKGLWLSLVLGTGMLLSSLGLSGQVSSTLVAKPFPSVRAQVGFGFHFMDFTCLNQWFRYYNYPIIPSGSGQGNIGVQWNLSSRWKAGIQLNQGSSGIQNQSGFRVQYLSGLMDLYCAYALVSKSHFQTGILGGLEFRRVEVKLERQMPADGSGLEEFLTGGGSFSNRTTGGRLNNTGRNLRGGMFAEYGSQKRTAYGIMVTGSTGSENRWEFNGQTMQDSPRMPLRSLRIEAYIGIRI